MSEYHGYWFWDLRNDKIIQAKDLLDEYWLLNCPQEYEGPYLSQKSAMLEQSSNHYLSENFQASLKEMEEFYFGEHN